VKRLFPFIAISFGVAVLLGQSSDLVPVATRHQKKTAS
jgi:hypothetical protein